MVDVVIDDLLSTGVDRLPSQDPSLVWRGRAQQRVESLSAFSVARETFENKTLGVLFSPQNSGQLLHRVLLQRDDRKAGFVGQLLAEMELWIGQEMNHLRKRGKRRSRGLLPLAN